MRLHESKADVPVIEALEAGETSGAVRVGGDTHLGRIEPFLGSLSQIVVDFAGHRDGRGFSLGSLLRQRGYEGELRAGGDLIADHAQMLARCGYDAVELPHDAVPAEWTKAAASFSAAYQPAADGLVPVWEQRRRARVRAFPTPVPTREDRVRELNAELRDAPAEKILQVAVEREFRGRIAMLSSFGAEGAVGLHMISRLDPSTPVLFLDTERHFQPTLDYRDRLVSRLGLSDVRSLRPEGAEQVDPRNDLWRSNPDACCDFRKVQPLARVIDDFEALVTGRKRFHGGERLRLPPFEIIEGRIRVNPLANWSAGEIDAYFEQYDLPRHPLVEAGYTSIGCWTCTRPASDPADVRSGRWAGIGKTECGIHMPSRWAAETDQRRAS